MMRQALALAAGGVFVFAIFGCSGGGSGSGSGGGGASPVITTNSILFVTQVPVPADFTTVTSTFGSHDGNPRSCARGGDLWIRYPQGTMKNLTATGGYGNEGFQGANAISVREPCVHWDGTKAVFSMVVGSPGQYQQTDFYWQLYEVTGFGRSETTVITKVPNQPAGFNNISPCYASDGRILFVSDRPRSGEAHLYPQLDEYEEQPTNTGLWSVDPSTGDLFLMEHAPSGSFSPSVDSFGRVIFTRWDHLERDQQADDERAGGSNYGTFNYSDESAASVPTASNTEVFPEPREQWIGFINGNPGYGGDMAGYEPNLVGNTFNHFFPWQINQDGTEEETVNHVGRHELHHYFPANRIDDGNIISFLGHTVFTANPRPIDNIFQMREDPLNPGTYLGIDAPEFFTHATGQIVRLHGPPGMSPDAMTVDYITHRETATYDDNPSPNHTGHYRNPLALSDGLMIASHTVTTTGDANVGTITHPLSLYDLRLKTIVLGSTALTAGSPLTSGITKTVSYWNPDQLVTYSGVLWELDPCEVRVRVVPPAPTPALPAPEMQSLTEEGVALSALTTYLRNNDLALLVSRNLTTRDRNDRQQPYNLRVAGTATETLGAGGTVYDIAHVQFFQGDQLRGLTFGDPSPRPGRRVIAQTMHDPSVANPPNPTGPAGSVQIAPDGSMAALVPARRAMSWQLTDPAGEAVVRERYWLTFQPGEIRTCGSCHGLSSADQTSQPPPQNKPQALNLLLQHLQSQGAF